MNRRWPLVKYEWRSGTNLSIDAIDYINAHGTGTVANDIKELKSSRRYSATIRPRGHTPVDLFDEINARPRVGREWCLELIAIIEAIRHGIVPSPINIEQLDPECDLDVTPPVVREPVQSGPPLAMPSHSAGQMRSSR